MKRSDPTRIRRLPERAVADPEAIAAILDEGFVCHVSYIEGDRPYIIPTLYAHDRERVILHGSTAAGFVRAARRGSPLTVAVTIVDGIVVARSGFHSSANYRSVVIHGLGRVLEGEEHRRALDLTIEALIPGRLADLRGHTEVEVRQTATVEVPLHEVSAKVRTGPPHDDPDDLGSELWAGVVPLHLHAGDPKPDDHTDPAISTPDYLSPYRRCR